MVQWIQADINAALIGGVLISLAMGMNFYQYGRRTEMTDFFNSLIKGDRHTGFFWKFCFFYGFIFLPFVIFLSKGSMFYIGSQRFVMFDSNAYANESLSIIGWLISGLLIGVGARMAKGDTSHLTLGMPLLMNNSFVATLVLIASGMAIASLRGHEHFLDKADYFGPQHKTIWNYITLGIFILLTISFAIVLLRNLRKAVIREILFTFVSGLIFGLGFVMSQMARISKVRGFLKLGHGMWDPTILIALLTVLVINLISFSLIKRRIDL